jgi:XRE family transcriptional regulator, regulator of sulfur utilization
VGAAGESGRHLAENLRRLRDARGLSQGQLAKQAGVPRATWTNLESGSANPTLAVLTRVAATLRVSIEELISPPQSETRLYRPAALVSRSRTGVTVRQLLPDPIPGLQLERMSLPAGKRMAGVPHTPGTREYLTCELGVVALTVAGETFTLAPGDVLVFRGDQRHSYHNPGDRPAVAYSAVLLAPRLS